ncbi:spondin domain-containing protein [soil metagenome]
MRGRILAGLASIACLAALAVAPVGAAEPPVATYEVTIENLTDGQPYTPPLIATHRAATDILTVGQPASFEIKEIAENGNLGPMMTLLGSDKHVFDTAVAAGPLLFGGSVTLTVTAAKGANFLSFASMLICTNDGFTGVDALRLPKSVGDEVVITTAGYDAGTERNTEDYKDIVPPCQGLHGVMVEPGTDMSNPALAEGGVIHHHPGIQGGVDDLTVATHDWSNPVAEVTVERVS